MNEVEGGKTASVPVAGTSKQHLETLGAASMKHAVAVVQRIMLAGTVRNDVLSLAIAEAWLAGYTARCVREEEIRGQASRD